MAQLGCSHRLRSEHLNLKELSAYGGERSRLPARRPAAQPKASAAAGWSRAAGRFLVSCLH